MKSMFGDCFQISLFGESHSAAVGVTINGLAAGIKLDSDRMNRELDRRRAKGKISTARKEADVPIFISGLVNGVTTGTPLCIIIENTNVKSGDYEKTHEFLRPSHADFTAHEKYGGFEDYRGGGHFSGRLTAPIVAAGAIAEQILEARGITIATHILKLKDISDVKFSDDEEMIKIQAAGLLDGFPAIDRSVGEKMQALIEAAAADGNSVGGVLETAICGMPTGIGEPFFNSIESKLSHLLFSIPAVKGVQFGLGFDITDLYGSEANDAFTTDGKKISTVTNNNGGINGGISNGMPIIVKTAVKPTASIFKEQNTVNINTMKNEAFSIKGRHDPAIIHRAAPVADAMAAIGLLDLFCERYGSEWTRI